MSKSQSLPNFIIIYLTILFLQQTTIKAWSKVLIESKKVSWSGIQLEQSGTNYSCHEYFEPEVLSESEVIVDNE